MYVYTHMSLVCLTREEQANKSTEGSRIKSNTGDKRKKAATRGRKAGLALRGQGRLGADGGDGEGLVDGAVVWDVPLSLLSVVLVLLI